MRAGIFTTTIEKVETLGVQDTRHFKLAFAPDTEFDFEAGQFVNIMLPPTEGDKIIKRPYSIASSPVCKGSIDLCWKRISGGKVTNLLWDLKEGDALQVQGPLGRFTLKKPLAKSFVFVSTGTGIAPFRAMIRTLLHNKENCQITNIFGNRYEDDILYQKEFEELEKEHANFKNVFTVSRPKTWKGETDYVQIMLKKHLTTNPETLIYICGLSAMIQAVEATALEMGFLKEQIHYEKYD